MNPSAILSDPEFPELKRLLIEQTGLGYYADKDEDLAARIARRLTARGMCDLPVYLAGLRRGSEAAGEKDALIGELTVGETYFFRQPEHFAALRDKIVPELLARNAASRRLRIWSAGCATGAEAYSLAILCRLELAGQLMGWDVSILATDINRDFLERARAGRFDHWAFRQAPEDLKARCFVRDRNQWIIRPEYRGLVKFEYHNLIRDCFSTGTDGTLAFDIILCRNVMIYFGAGFVRATVRRLYDQLAEGGWLLVGHAEPNAEVFRPFQTVILAGTTYYRKSSAPAADAEPVSRGLNEPSASPLPAPRAAPHGSLRRSTSRPAPVRPAEIPSVEHVRALADRGQWETASSQCEKLLASNGLDAAAHFTHGLILEHTRGPDEAGRALRRAVYLDRGFALAHYHLGLCLQKTKSARKARKAFENVIDLLAAKRGDEPLEHGDGITAAELRELAAMHLELPDSA